MEKCPPYVKTKSGLTFVQSYSVHKQAFKKWIVKSHCLIDIIKKKGKLRESWHLRAIEDQIP